MLSSLSCFFPFYRSILHVVNLYINFHAHYNERIKFALINGVCLICFAANLGYKTLTNHDLLSFYHTKHCVQNTRLEARKCRVPFQFMISKDLVFFTFSVKQMSRTAMKTEHVRVIKIISPCQIILLVIINGKHALAVVISDGIITCKHGNQCFIIE